MGADGVGSAHSRAFLNTAGGVRKGAEK